MTSARKKAGRSLRELQELVGLVRPALDALAPSLFGWDQSEREKRGYSIEVLNGLLGDQSKPLVDDWRDAATAFRSKLNEFKAAIEPHERRIATLQLDTVDHDSAARARESIVAIAAVVDSVAIVHARYKNAHTALADQLEPVLARKTNTDSWTALLALASDPVALVRAIREDRAAEATRSDLERALKDIDGAIADVLDSKYQQLGDDVAKWWSLMRPDTTTRFSGLRRAGSGRRFIDMKAGLFESETSKVPTHLRDAVSVFSESQLNCLGLAAFLARAVRQKSGFVVLDDPFPGSDADHRTLFLEKVLPALVAEGIQVILLTHDDRAAVDAQTLYADSGIDSYKIGLADPVTGAAISRTRDDLDVLLARADGLLNSSSASTEGRKLAAQHLRDAAERFCKLAIIKDRASRGIPAVLSELNRTLGVLVPMTEPLLTHNPGDPGKLRVMAPRLNPGNHDDSVPNLTDLKITLGNLRAFKKRYLDLPS